MGVCAGAAGEADERVAGHQLQSPGHLFSSTFQEEVQAESGPRPSSSEHQLGTGDDGGVKVHEDEDEDEDVRVDVDVGEGEGEEAGEEVEGDHHLVEGLFSPAYHVQIGEDHEERNEVEAADSGRTEEVSLLMEASQ